MKLDTTLEVVDVLGKPLTKDFAYKCGKCNYQGIVKGKKWTVLDVCIESLSFVTQDDNLSGEDKYKRHKLMDKIANAENGKAELSILEDVPLLKECVDKFCGVAMCGFMRNLLEDASKSKDKE